MEKKDSLLMLKYMISEGFNPNNYERILELLQSAPLSLSKNLKEYNPYLLSKNWLDKHGIKYHKLIANSGEKGIVCFNNKIDLWQ